MHGLAGHDPAHMCPDATIAWRVRIAVFIGVLVVDPVSGYPEHGATFQGQGAAYSEEILNPLGRPVAAMGQQAVVAHAYTEASRNPPEEGGNRQRLPAE